MARSPLFLLALLCSAAAVSAQNGSRPVADGDELLRQYFELQTRQIESESLAEIKTLEGWNARKGEYRRQLLEMLGLDPMPAKTDLDPKVHGTQVSEDVIVERLQFQSMPGLYVTANLYRPAASDAPLPAILYVCGHGREKQNGVSLGNKTHYQHHGAWFARNGYVCLTIDTIQLGEIEGIHHGTYREGMWWWNSRGYTPAGVEAYNCIRSLDYLQTRPEVDGERIGVTGRSGGGAYSWWIAAIDDRIKAAVPVAGITSLRNHVVDGCVEGHCDCMYMLNSYRWDFDKVAALVAPRPLLISNSDKDRIFPLEGVVDVHRRVRAIYELHDAADHLGLHLTEGPHRDTQELRIAAFRWMNRFLRQDESLIESAATPLFEKAELRVFEDLPDDERVTSIHESFVPRPSKRDSSRAAASKRSLRRTLLRHCFQGWPERDGPLNLQQEDSHPPKEISRDLSTSVIHFDSQIPYRLPIYHLHRERDGGTTTKLIVADEERWSKLAPGLAAFFPEQFPDQRTDAVAADRLLAEAGEQDIMIFAPRGIGPTAWDDTARTRTHVRRRFMLLGQTQAGMQVFDLVRGLSAAEQILGAEASLVIEADGAAAFLTLHAIPFITKPRELRLSGIPSDYRSSPDLLNVSRALYLKDVLACIENAD